MQTVIILVHLFIVLALIGVVLPQRSEGGLGLGGGGGGGFMTGRGQANALTRATAILAGLFFLTSMVLSLFASYGHGPRSIFDANAPRQAPAGQQAPSGANVLDQLRQMQSTGQGSQPAAPAPEPAAPQVPQSR